MKKIQFFKKKKIKKIKISKSKFLFVPFLVFAFLKQTKKTFLYQKHIFKYSGDHFIEKKTFFNKFITITQKFNNPKCTISSTKTINTFSVGCLLRFFKLPQGKFVRRSLKGLRVFLNFLKNIFVEKYSQQKDQTILNITGFDYNLINTKKTLSSFFEKTIKNNNIFILNVKVPFTKVRSKKIKSIKKRFKKKMVKTFLEKI